LASALKGIFRGSIVEALDPELQPNLPRNLSGGEVKVPSQDAF
jgi:hypothetical protein